MWFLKCSYILTTHFLLLRVNEVSCEQERASDGSNLAIDTDHESTPSSLGT